MPDNTHQIVQSSVAACKKIWSHSKKVVQQLGLRKDMSAVQFDYETRNQLRKSLTLSQLIGLGLGGTIGTGIFVLSGQAAAKYAGPSIIISFIIAGIAALLSTLSMSEMAALMPSSGSAYTYTYVALGEYPAFLIGWLSTLLYQLGASVVVVRWSHFVVHFINLISSHNTTSSLVQAPIGWSEDADMFYVTGQAINLPAIAITIAITVILFLGIRETAIFNLIFVVFKVIVLLIFIFACCSYVDRKNYEPFFPTNQGSFKSYGATGMLQASTFVFFAYVGFESITAASQEAQSPDRLVPIALISSLVITMLIYIGVVAVLVGLVPYGILNTTYPLAEASKATPFGTWLPILLDLGAIASLTTVATTLFLAQSRILYSMAHDGLLPSFFARIHNTRKTPWVSIVITGVICGIFSGICPIDILGEMTSIGALITYLAVHISLIIIRFTHHQVDCSFKVSCSRCFIPVVGSLLCILLLSNTSKGTAIRFGVWMGICHIVYFSYSFWFSKARLEKREESVEYDPEPVFIVMDTSEKPSNPEIIEEKPEDSSVTQF